MRQTFSWAVNVTIVILLVSSLMLLMGLGGTGLHTNVEIDTEYRPNRIGHVSIELKNRWWLRDIQLKQILISIDEIQNFEWEIEDYTSNISPGQTIRIQANLTILEQKLGIFYFNLTISYSQSLLFNLGSEEKQQVIPGNITISW